MTFTVTYRDQRGAKREEAIEAESRAACVAACRARGISPMAIREGGHAGRVSLPGGRRGSPPIPSDGRAGAPRPPRSNPHSHNSIFSHFHNSTFLGILVLLAILGGGAWWLFGGRGTDVSPDDSHVKTKSMPREVTPKAPKKVSKTEDNTPSSLKPAPGPETTTQKPFNPNEPPPGLLPNEPWRSGRKKLHEVRYVARNTNTVHRNSTEQALIDIFTCEVGDPPMPFTDLPKDDLDNMLKILQSPNPVTEKDAYEVRVGKDILEQAKKEMLKFLKDGGKPAEFLSYYHGILESAYQKRMIATEEIYKVLEEQKDPEIARAMLKRVNKELHDQGIRPLPIPLSVFQTDNNPEEGVK